MLNEFEQAALSGSIDAANLLSHQYLSLGTQLSLPSWEHHPFGIPKAGISFGSMLLQSPLTIKVLVTFWIYFGFIFLNHNKATEGASLHFDSLRVI